MIRSVGGRITLLHQRAAQDGMGGRWGAVIGDQVAPFENEARALVVPGNGNGNL